MKIFTLSLIGILIISMGTFVFAHTSHDHELSVITNESSYDEGDPIEILVKVSEYDGGTFVIQIWKDSYIIDLDQGEITNSGDTDVTYSYTTTAEGPSWTQGAYVVRVGHHEISAETTFTLETLEAAKELTTQTSDPFATKITIKMEETTYYLDSQNQIIRASVEIQNFTPSDGQYFMKVTHLPTQKVLRNFEIDPKNYGNDLWGVLIAYPILKSDIEIGGQTLFGEYEINIRTESSSETASAKFSIFEYTYGPESRLVPAETSTSLDIISVKISAETSDPGCEILEKCYIPWEAIIEVGQTIEWLNYDTEAHTVTSTTLEGDPFDEFDSGLINYGKKFSHTFDKSGKFYYFCTLHPWMSGNVIVGKPSINEPEPQIQIDQPSIELEAEPSDESIQKIPDWVKNTMEWYLDDIISENEMISAFQYLVKQEIIKLD